MNEQRNHEFRKLKKNFMKNISSIESKFFKDAFGVPKFFLFLNSAIDFKDLDSQ